MAHNTKYKAQGRDFAGGQFITTELEFNLPNPPGNPGPVKGRGIPVSVAFFKELQRRYLGTNTPPPEDSRTQSVTFSMEAILSVLAQNDCAGIKFYFVEREGTTTKQLTLVMAGVEVNGKDLVTVRSSEESYLVEVGNGIPPNT